MRFPSAINWIQSRLDFENWNGYPQFEHKNVRMKRDGKDNSFKR